MDDPQASSSLVINSRLANQAHLPYWGVIRRNERIPIDDPTTKTVHKGKNSRPPRRRSLPIIYQKAPPDSTSSAESSHPPATQVCGSEIPEAKLQPNVGAGKAPRPRRCDTIVARYGNEAAGRIWRNQPYTTDLARSRALAWDSTVLLHRLVRSPTRASPYPVVSLQGFQIRHTRPPTSPPNLPAAPPDFRSIQQRTGRENSAARRRRRRAVPQVPHPAHRRRPNPHSPPHRPPAAPPSPSPCEAPKHQAPARRENQSTIPHCCPPDNSYRLDSDSPC